VKYLAAAAFVATVYAANWALSRWGLVPVGFGYQAPAGVYFAGLGFILRDVLHELGGRVWVVGAILAGAVLSFLLGADAAIPGGHVTIAAASAAAFLIAELCDFAVYAPLRERGAIAAAVGLSQVVAAALDSVLFLWLAFGSLALFPGQMIGKTLMVVPVVAAVAVWRARTSGRLRA
jgi:uncharacterized PurR-regulated membrane protein YhhQ (DUF165 family)